MKNENQIFYMAEDGSLHPIDDNDKRYEYCFICLWEFVPENPRDQGEQDKLYDKLAKALNEKAADG